jgi:hypothetical protein
MMSPPCTYPMSRLSVSISEGEKTFTVQIPTMARVMPTTDTPVPQRTMKALEEQLRRIREATTPHPRQTFREAVIQMQDRSEIHGGA